MARDANDVLRGTLDLLVLKTLEREPMHGWAVAQRIQQLSGDALKIGQGSLYPALHRLEQQGWIDSEWGSTEENRPAKYYRLTRRGQRALAERMASWRDYARLVEQVLQG